MTTIAYRGGCIAADSKAGMGGTTIGTMRKIARNTVGDLAGASGLAIYNARFLRWFEAGEDGPPPCATSDENNTDRAVIFRRDGKIEIYEEDGMFELSAPYFAIGSGADVALGAMYAGAGASDAVRAAIEHDLYSGGDVGFLLAADTATAKLRTV